MNVVGVIAGDQERAQEKAGDDRPFKLCPQGKHLSPVVQKL
jgi:hypothetical protein